MVTIPRDRALAVVTAAGAAGYWLFARRALRLGAVRLAAGGALLAALAAIVAFAAFVGAALAPLAGLSFGVGGTLGIMLMVTAMLLCLVISVLRRPPRPPSRVRARGARRPARANGRWRFPTGSRAA